MASLSRYLTSGLAATLLVAGGAAPINAAMQRAAAACSLGNPITTGADPSIWYANGQYYLVQSDGNASINLRSASTLGGLSGATPHTIWTAPSGTDHSAEIWAPELEFLNGEWVIYFAAAKNMGGDPATNNTHRIFAITNTNAGNPYSSWTYFGKIVDSTNQWMIDPTVFYYNSNWWMLWSGTPPGNGGSPPQQIYIAHMSDPLHINQDYRRLIANPDQSWETSVQAIEEGPEAFIGPNNTLTILYSANASWTTSYVMGELVYLGGDMTQYTSYSKRGPVLYSGGGVYGTGGASLVVPGFYGGDWLVYHAKTTTSNGWSDRKIFAEPQTWNGDGTPHFSAAVAGYTAFDESTGQSC